MHRSTTASCARLAHVSLVAAMACTAAAGRNGVATAPGSVNRPSTTASAPRFEVRLEDDELAGDRRSGRLFIVMARDKNDEPRQLLDETGVDSPVRVARDVESLSARTAVVVDATAVAFPIANLAALPPGRYFVQAVFDSNIDVQGGNAPGNLYSDVAEMRTDGTTHLVLNRRVPEETLPRETEYIRFVKLQSRRLSEFHGRPIFLRAGVVVPADYRRDHRGGYPVRVQVGGYGERFTGVLDMMAPGSAFREAWLAPDAPRMLLVHLDGAGPLGDPYQIDSANHGPYGAAITTELIPHIERTFGGAGRGTARVVTGGSTGGWVSLALQILYPDFFNGAWSFCPDSVDFRAFQLVDIYQDDNAFVNPRGFERPSARERNGDVRFTMRHEVQLENLLGVGNSWTMSGGQWGAWNATYGPRAADGRPKPLWDPLSGAIDRSVVDHWKRYDLRRVLESRWQTLGPMLDGKLRIAVGEADNYFLNSAVHMLDDFLRSATPRIKYRITYGPGEGHCWEDVTEAQLLEEMRQAVR